MLMENCILCLNGVIRKSYLWLFLVGEDVLLTCQDASDKRKAQLDSLQALIFPSLEKELLEQTHTFDTTFTALLQTFSWIGHENISRRISGHRLGLCGSGCRIQRLNAWILRWG